MGRQLPSANFKLQTLKIFRCLYRRCLPLPIPNREVKPARADGTAVKRGRVGRCPILSPLMVLTFNPSSLLMRGFCVLKDFGWKFVIKYH
jgi:hypothetical protein